MSDCPKHTNPYPSNPQTALQVIALRALWLDLDLSKVAAGLGLKDDLSGAIAAAQVDGLRNAVGCLLKAASKR